MPAAKTYTVTLPMNQLLLTATLSLPPQAKAIVIFCPESINHRLNPREQLLTQRLNQASIATLNLELLSKEKESADKAKAELSMDIDLLAHSLISITKWAKTHPGIQHLKIAYFGAGTGAAAALIAAAKLPEDITTVVTRGERPHLAGEQLAKVKAPTLLIVGGRDKAIIRFNQQAQQKLHTLAQLTIIPYTNHRFTEPGALEQVAELAKNWFLKFLSIA